MQSEKWLSMLSRSSRGHDLDSADRTWLVHQGAVLRGISIPSSRTSGPRMEFAFPVAGAAALPYRRASAGILWRAVQLQKNREPAKAMRILGPLLASHDEAAAGLAAAIQQELRRMPRGGPVDRALLQRVDTGHVARDEYDIAHEITEDVLHRGRFERVERLVESWERLGLADRAADLLRFGFTTSGEIAVPHGTDSEDSP